MTFDHNKYQGLVKKAVAHYWRTLTEQGARQSESDADRGGRAAVTGGKQMDGFCHVVRQILTDCGLPDAHIFYQAQLELPGFYRPTKLWDMLVVSHGRLVAAMEFKSQRGPSFGNNFNNRSEEAIGTATDLWTAYREGAFGDASIRPWLGWVMLLEDCDKSTKPVKVDEPHFKVFPEFNGASYAKRYEILLRKLVRERLYDSAVFLMASEKGGNDGLYREPAEDLTMKIFLAGLAGHVSAHVAAFNSKT
jgi:hypothetical protein